MSFGIFEAAAAEDLNHTRRKKLAGDRLAQAAAEVDHKLGPMLAKSTSVNDYHDRVRLAEKDFRNIVGKYLEGDSGFIAVAKKLEPHYTKRRSRTASRKTAARVDWTSYEDRHFGTVFTAESEDGKLVASVFEPNEWTGTQFHWSIVSSSDLVDVASGNENTLEEAMEEAGRTLANESRTASRRVANADLEDLKEFVHSLGAKTRKRRGRDGFTFPAASGANGAVSVRPNGEIVVETLFGGGAGGMQSVYSPNEIDLVKDWIEKTVGGSYRLSRRKKANPWRSPDDALGSGYFPGWQTDHNEDGWWQINSPDGSDALVGEEDGSYTMRMDAETPEEAWAERMNFDEALQESEALHYRKNGRRRTAQDDDFDWLENAESGTKAWAWDPRAGEETEGGDYTGDYIEFSKKDTGNWYNQDYMTDLSAEELAGNERPVKRSNFNEALRYSKRGGRRRRANAVGQVVDLSGLDQLPIGSVVKTLADDGAASYELEKTGDNQWLWARAGMTVDNNYIGKATVEFIP